MSAAGAGVGVKEGGGLTNSSSSRGVTMIPCRRRKGELDLRKDTLTLFPAVILPGSFRMPS